MSTRDAEQLKVVSVPARANRDFKHVALFNEDGTPFTGVPAAVELADDADVAAVVAALKSLGLAKNPA